MNNWRLELLKTWQIFDLDIWIMEAIAKTPLDKL